MNRDWYLKRTSLDYVKFTGFKVKVNKLLFEWTDHSVNLNFDEMYLSFLLNTMTWIKAGNTYNEKTLSWKSLEMLI